MHHKLRKESEIMRIKHVYGHIQQKQRGPGKRI